MPTPFLPSNCTRCGYTGESILSHRGPHIKQSCGHCKAYIKFIDRAIIPDLREIKIAIMSLAGGMITDIEAAKKEVYFFAATDVNDQKVQYWKLLIHFIDKNRKETQTTML